MSREVNVYTKGGGGSIGWVPGVVPAAWGGPGRARGAVRAVPKTRNYDTTRVKNTRILALPTFLALLACHGHILKPQGGVRREYR